MASRSEAPHGDAIAHLIEEYDQDLASFIRQEERLHQRPQRDPSSPDAVVTFVNDLAIPGRFQTEAYARNRILTAVPDMSPAQVEAEVAARMARSRYRNDPSRVFITERVLNLDVPEADVCLRGLVELTRDTTLSIVCRIVPDAAITENRGGLALVERRGLIMPGQDMFYVEPDDPNILLQDARSMVQSANQFALPIEASLALIDQRIAGR